MVAVGKKELLAEVEKLLVEIAVDKETVEKNKDLGQVVVDKVVVDKKYLGDKVAVSKKYPENKVAVVEIDILAVVPADLN